MSRPFQKLVLFTGAALATLALAGCAYDYLNHTDKVGLSAGDAVKANLERETSDPAKASSYDVKGLGKNGNVTPAAPAE